MSICLAEKRGIRGGIVENRLGAEERRGGTETRNPVKGPTGRAAGKKGILRGGTSTTKSIKGLSYWEIRCQPSGKGGTLKKGKSL